MAAWAINVVVGCAFVAVKSLKCEATTVAPITLPPTMDAFIATDPTNRKYAEDFPVPTIGDLAKKYGNLPSACEVLIRVGASSVNPSDIQPTIATDLFPHVLGSDVAGTVVSVNSSCDCKVQVGQRVFGDIGANTISAETRQKTKELGGYAEFALALDTQIAAFPTSITMMEAGSLPKVALTSYKALVWYAEAKNESFFRGSTVLILGGSGGTGSVGLQLAKYFGASKIITTTSSSNFAYCKSLGATHVIDYHLENWWDDAVFTNSSVDVVYDTVGQENTGNRAMRILRSPGYFVTIAGKLASDVKPGVKQSFFINSDTNLNSAPLLREIASIVGANKLRMPLLNPPYALQDVEKAFRVSEGGHVVGKLVVNITNSV